MNFLFKIKLSFRSPGMLAETLLRSLVHAEKTDLIRIDPEGIVLFASGESIPGFLQRTDSLRGASFFDLFAKMSGPLAAAKQALRGETTSTADWNQGRMLELQMFPERSENGDIVGAIGIARDQTEAATLDGSKENQWLLETAFESIQDGVMVLDRNLVVRQANKVIRSWLPEVVPNRYTCYKTLVGIDEPCSFCPCLKTFKTGERFEYIYYNPNYKRWYELTTHPIIDPNTKEVVLVVEFVRDVDETVNAQKKLEEYRNQLEKMVDDRTHALRESESRMQVLLSNSN